MTDSQKGIDSKYLSSFFVLQKISSKGHGLVARKRIAADTLIIDETPILLYSNDDIEDKQIAWKLFNALNVEKQEFISTVSCSIQYDKSGMDADKLMDIIQRNNIEVIPDSLNALFPTIVRLNHSCCPNTIWFWDKDSQSQRVITIKDVEKGEELSAMYCKHGYSRALRRKYPIQMFGFWCLRPRCNLADAQEIAFYDRINRIYSRFVSRLSKCMSIGDVAKMITMVEKTK